MNSGCLHSTTAGDLS